MSAKFIYRQDEWLIRVLISKEDNFVPSKGDIIKVRRKHRFDNFCYRKLGNIVYSFRHKSFYTLWYKIDTSYKEKDTLSKKAKKVADNRSKKRIKPCL
jgi:hypothetical protein